MFKSKNILTKLLKRNEINEKIIKLRSTNDSKIIEELILGTMYLVTYYARFYSKEFMLELDEIEQCGYEGLIKAIDRFDLLKDKEFYMYAVGDIKGYIQRGIKKIYVNIPR